MKTSWGVTREMLKYIDKGCHPNIEYIVKSVNFEQFLFGKQKIWTEYIGFVFFLQFEVASLACSSPTDQTI